MANYYGIDFGTTNSAVYSISAIDKNIADAFPIGENDRQPLPSYVAIHKQTGKVVTGIEAKNSILEGNEYQVFTSIKSIIGEEKEWYVAGKTWTPIDITAELFKALKKKSEDRTRNSMKEAVVAVPVGFSSDKKNNLRKASKLAGIRINMFVSEPTSAYCSHMEEMKKYHNVAVFDWGGGTLDVVVLRIENNIVNELSAVGLKIAGNDIDRKLAERVCLNASNKGKVNFNFDDLSKEAQQRILQKCERAKCNLADEDIASITDLKLDNYGALYEKIDYDYFALLIENEINQAIDCLLNALSEAGMNRESIDCILCEGGSSRLRPLQAALLRYFDREKLVFPKKAMWDIATGAAQISYKPGCYTLNKPIGIIQSNNTFYPLLKVGQRIPTEQKEVTFGITELAKEARFILTDGESEESQTFINYFPVKLRGFSDEVLKVSCFVDTDMVFKMKVHSNRMPDDVFRVWTYPNLKLSYEVQAPDPERNY